MDKRPFPVTAALCLGSVGLYALLTGSGAGLGALWAALSPILVGVLFALVLNVPLRFFERRVFGRVALPRLRRGLSVAATYLSVTAAAALVVLCLIPQLSRSMAQLLSRLPGYAIKLDRFLAAQTGRADLPASFAQSLSAAIQEIVTAFSSWITTAAERLLGATFDLAAGIVDLVVSLMLSVYILLSKDSLASVFKRIGEAFLPQTALRKLLFFLRLADRKFSCFIAGQVLEGLLLGLLCAIGMMLIGLPYPHLVGIVIGATALVPVIGPWVGTLISAVLILFESPVQALIFVLFELLLQQIDNSLIYPRLMGTAVGLDALWILAVVTVGGALGGAAGMVLAVPIFSTLWVIGRRIVDDRLKARRPAQKKGGEPLKPAGGADRRGRDE